MKTCPNCRCQVNDDAVFCPVCGTAIDSIPSFPETYYSSPIEQPVLDQVPSISDPFDHTDDFLESDIKDNKLVCMIVYLLDFFGIIIALLMNKSSDYVQFHIHQSMKFTIIEILLSLLMIILFWTFVIPILGAIAGIVLMVIKFVSFTQVCEGKAKEPVIIRSIGFLK